MTDAIHDAVGKKLKAGDVVLLDNGATLIVSENQDAGYIKEGAFRAIPFSGRAPAMKSWPTRTHIVVRMQFCVRITERQVVPKDKYAMQRLYRKLYAPRGAQVHEELNKRKQETNERLEDLGVRARRVVPVEGDEHATTVE